MGHLVGNKLNIVGVDECSYGSWVGHVWAAAVMLDETKPIAGLNDSKKLNPETREKLALEIKEKAKSFGIGFATAKEIDEIGVLKASHLAMVRALEQIDQTIDKVLVDGNKVPDWKWSAEAIVQGDATIQEIMAASILAKTSRTEEMRILAEKHPEYKFDQHQGYGTAVHAKAIDDFGVLDEHRKTYKPIKAAQEKWLLKNQSLEIAGKKLPKM